MKAGRPHKVPLSKPALGILDRMAQMKDGSGLIFLGQKFGVPAVRSNHAGSAITREMVIDDCTQRLFGQPLVTNIVRGTFVEAMINLALRDTGWRQCIAWAGWDFEHDSTRLEVRQAASRQPRDKARKISDREIKFDITPRTGHWAVEGFVEDHSTAPPCEPVSVRSPRRH